MMRKAWQLLACVGSLLVLACSTPAAVQQLSVAQLRYFDTAIEAVKLQSDALLLAAEKLMAQAEQRLAQRVEAVRTRLETLAVETLPKLDEGQRRRATQQMLEDADRTNLVATESRAKLANDLAALKAKTQELQAYMIKMKEVQVVLNAYLQSAQVGAQVTQTIVKQPSVENLLDQVNRLIPHVTSTLTDVQHLVSGSNVVVATTAPQLPQLSPPQPRQAPQLVQPRQPPQPPENSFLSEDQRKSVQRRLCVEDDGVFGKTTRRAIREYQAAIGVSPHRVPLGQLDEEQAKIILQQLPECPRQFGTYYEVWKLSQPGAVKTLQETLNMVREAGIISSLTPLDITGELNSQTREALKALQKRFRVSPADGVYTMETANALNSHIQRFGVGEDVFTKALHDFWKPDGQTINTANAEKLRVAMRKAGVPDSVFITTFLRAGELAEQRKKVAQELGL